MLGEAPFDVGESCADAVLVAFQRREVDCVSEVRREELVALSFKPCPVGGEVGDLLVLSGALLIERGIDFGGEVTVVVFADRDVAVGVLDQPLGYLHGHGTAGTGGLPRGAAGADEVGVGGAARVGGEVE